MKMRIGHGYDAHRFEAGRKLILGGVTIPYQAGLAAHSDGDVAIHALCDAVIGALALGDIGKHFPDNQADYKDIDSRLLLRHVIELMCTANYRVANADVTIVAQVPKLAAYIEAMRLNLAGDLMIQLDQMNVKATTTEKMGFVGREEGIAAYAVVLLEKICS